MFRTRQMCRVNAILLLLISITVAAPDAAAEQHSPLVPRRITELELKVSQGRATPAVRARELACSPLGGNHPYRQAACRDLMLAGGDFEALPGEPDRTCSGLYAPVTVTALGQWRGMPLRFRNSYLNSCKLRAATGPVFGF